MKTKIVYEDSIVSNSKDAFKEKGKNNFIQITIYKDSQFAYIEINDNGKITAINKQFEIDKIKYMGAMFTITLPLKL